MKSFLFAAAFLCTTLVSSCQPNKPAPTDVPVDGKAAAIPTKNGDNIQIALLLDCSGSMDGLIEQAKSQLWKMVTTLASTQRNGKTPNIQIALYEYGKDDNSVMEGYVRQLSGMTSDLDKISELLFAMKTNGGEEYCGHAIRTAVNDLQWSDSKKDLKIIVIAGNEPFNQGTVEFRASCKAAADKGIVINTVHCGDCQVGVNTFWKEGATIGKGQYMCINTDAVVRHIPTPYDQLIIDLNVRLNGTYIGYGSRGQEMKIRQEVQDKNAAEYGAANIATRSAAKASASVYRNGDWDVVDAATEDKDFAKKIAKAPKAEQPDEFKGMTAEQINAKIATLTKERNEIQAQIRDLSAKSATFRAEEEKKLSGSNSTSLDGVMIKTIKEQAKEKGFE